MTIYCLQLRLGILSQYHILEGCDRGSTRFWTLNNTHTTISFNIKFKISLYQRDWVRKKLWGTITVLISLPMIQKRITAQRAGLSIPDPQHNQSYRLENHVTVSQAELFAHLKAVELARFPSCHHIGPTQTAKSVEPKSGT